MNKSTTYLVIGAVVLAIAAGAVWFQAQKSNQGQELAQQEEQEGQQEENPGLAATAVVLYTENGFAPQIFIMKAGETVTFVNGSSNPMWPATAVHPTHKVYPGSDSAKCGTADANKIFDACQAIATGSEWSFTFTEKGSWGYHDHLNPNIRGTIVVE